MDDSLAYALAHRPEITQMQDNLAIAAAQVRIARSSALPTVELSGTKGWEDLNLPGYKYGDWTVSLIANFDVFDSGRTKAAMKKAEYEIQVLQGQVRQVRDNISLEVSQAYQNLKEAEKRIETSNVAVEQARLDFKLAQERYDNGISINLDVVDAELALTQAKTNYIQALYDYNTSRAQLDKAMGVPVR
jgi:outer membrane protein TolC